MALFELPTRNNSKSNDMKIAKQSKVKKTAPTVIRGGSSLLDLVNIAQKEVDSKLGYLKDRYILIQDKGQLDEYIDECIKNGVISIDTETTGLDPLQDDIAGICIYTPNQKGAYIPINHVSYITNEKLKNQLSVEEVRQSFERITDIEVRIQRIDIIMFNADFDIRVLRHTVGLHNIYCTWDCYLAQRLLNENEPYGGNKLKPLHQKYVLNGEQDVFSFSDLFKGIPFTMVPLKTAVVYAAHDAEITYELYDYQRQFLREDNEREDMRKLYWTLKNIEMPCVDAVANMEDNGILIDLEYQQELSVKYNKLLQDKLEAFHSDLEQYSDEIAKYKAKTQNNKLDDVINIASPVQLAILFYDIIGIGVVDKKNPRGTGEEILSKIDNVLAKDILEYRELSKLVDTYIDKLPNCINSNDGRIHCKFNQYGTVTGRFSSKDPNLQNIPSHNKDIRKMFVPSPGYVLMSSDYSQQEPKCLAAMCRLDGDSQLYDTFMAGRQVYADIASIAFHKPYEDCLEFYLDENGNETTKVNPEGKERRARAKKILLASLYGMGEPGIAEDLNISLAEATKIKEAVYKGVPAIAKFEDESLAFAQEHGYVTTIVGRKRRLPDLQLDEYEFQWKNGVAPDDDLLDFDNDEEYEIPERTIRRYLTRLHNCRFKEKRRIFEQANEEGIWIVDNGAKISKAVRQVVNSRIQGSAADLTKLAMIELNNSERLKELGFRLLIQVHDEIIAECPKEHMKECSELLADIMSKAAEKILEMPIKCDVTITDRWYGEEIDYGSVGVK